MSWIPAFAGNDTLTRLWLRGNYGPGSGRTRLAGRRHAGALAPAGHDRVFVGRADRRNTLEQRHDLVARQGFIFKKAARQHIQVALVVGKDLLGPDIALIDNAM